MTARIFIADDHPIFRRGLIDLIEGDSSLTIVGDAEDGNEALELIRKLKPNVVVVDLSMPGLGGFEVIREIQKTNLNVEFIILTIYKDDEYINEAIDLDVKGYILKGNAEMELLSAIKAVVKGDHYLSHAISQQIINKIKMMKKLEEEKPSIKKLTKTERRVLKLTSENKSCKEIAKEMHISPKTVENHRKNISTKLILKGRNKLLQFAIEHKSSL